MTSRPTRNVRRKTAWRGLTGPLPGLAAVADAVADSWWVASDDEETPFPSKCIRRTGVSCARATSDRTERSSRQDDDDDDDDCRRVILLSSETRDDYAFWTSAFPSLSLSLLSLIGQHVSTLCNWRHFCFCSNSAPPAHVSPFSRGPRCNNSWTNERRATAADDEDSLT